MSASPLPASPEMTADHVWYLDGFIHGGAAMGWGGMSHMKEISALVRSLVSGELATYDPRTQVVIDRAELEQHREWLSARNLLRVETSRAFAGWLAASTEEATK